MSFGGILRQSTAVDVLIGPFVDSTDGDTEEAALTINRADVLLSKNGQGAVQKTDVTAAASDADGFYNCELDATDTDTVGQLVLYVHVAGALAVRHDFQIVEEEPYDDIFAASAVGYLKPTTAGRDLDVTAGGEAALDLDNTSGTIAAAQIATDAITAAKIAAGAITSSEAPNLDAAVSSRLAPTVAARTLDVNATGEAGLDLDNTSGTIAAAQIATDAITAAKIAAGAITASEAPNLDAAISTRATPAQVNAEVVDALATDTYAEPGQEAPAATNTLAVKIGYLFKFLRNRLTQTATELKVYADDATTVDQKSTVSDDATTYDRGEIGTGP